MKKYITLIMLMGALIPAGAQAQTLALTVAVPWRSHQQAAQCLEAQERRGVQHEEIGTYQISS